MKIGFDAKRYFHNQTGLGNYSRDLVNTLVQQFPENSYFLFDKKLSETELPKNTTVVQPSGNALLWRELGVMNEIQRIQPEVFHGLSNELPWGKWPSVTKKIVTIHDVIFKVFPEHYATIDRFVYEKKTQHAIDVSDIIIATSFATANDLKQYYTTNGDKIHVVYQTCGALHWKNYSQAEINDFKIKRQLEEPFMLYVSSFQTRKNHLQLLKAFHLLSNKNSRLVLAGKAKETYADCVRFIAENGLGKRVRLVSDIDNSELPLLYRSAQSFVYPSVVEGFGIPLIEAACAGLPIAANNIPVFNEIAPPDTSFFDVNKTEDIGVKMEDLMLMQNSNYSGHLNLFKPEYAARQMMQIYTSGI